jgi:hypothetical protein
VLHFFQNIAQFEKSYIMTDYKGIITYYRLEDILHPNFVVSVDRGKKRFFMNFVSVYHFKKWYAKLCPEERTMNEVIMSDRRKFIIDIDESDDNLLLMFDFERHVKARIHDVFTMLEIGIPDVIVYNMVDKSGNVCTDKLSYHIVISNFSFSAATCKGLCMIISSGQVWDKCVDKSVYKSVQCIRIEGSTKFGEKRWKQVIDDTANVSRPVSTKGFVSCIEDTVKSEFTCSLTYPTGITPFYNIDTSASLPTGITPFYNIDTSQFKLGKRTSTFVSLIRVKSGYCHQCNRIHDKDNAFIQYIFGQPTFVCWRYKSTH